MDKYIGRLLDNRYEILEIIGVGGMAVVYKARDHRLNRMVAIKILKDDYLQDAEFRRRFHAESQAIAMLGHPNIVAVYDVSTSPEADYIVMELIDGITLKQYMEKKGVLNWKETLHFSIQIAKALEHAHSRGVIHRDIKPHNIMVLTNGSVKVADFGIARMMSKGNTLTKEALGSVHYISPEQAKGGRVDNRSDIYSLGVVMYEMMSGRPPYDGESPVAVAIQHINGGAPMPSTLNPNIPGGLEQIIMKAMAHEPSDRYATATEMLRDMDTFRNDPSMLFDYHTPPLDDVTHLTHRTPEPEPRRTTAERVAGRAQGQRHEPQRHEPQGRSGSKPRSSSQQSPPARRQREPETDSRGSNAAAIAIVTCSLVAVIAIIVFLVALFNGGFSRQPHLVKVPDLIGEKYETLPIYSGLEIRLQDERYDDTYEAGLIIDQEPKAGVQIEEGNEIYVIVSRGPEPDVIVMDDVTNMTEAHARDFLGQYSLELQVKVLLEASDDVAEGLVIRTEPRVGTELSKGQIVTLWVSSGPAVKTAKMPNVVGRNIVTAINLLKAAGFNPDHITYESVNSKEAKDEVIEQSIAKNEEVPVDSNIILVVSNGPAPTETTAPTEEPTLPVRTKTVKITLPEEYAGQACTVSVRQGNVVIWEKEVDENTTEIEIELTGSGMQTYDLYINGKREGDGIEVVFG